MRLRIIASLLNLLCAWVLWEHWTSLVTGVPSREVNAVSETQSLEECRGVIPQFVTEREAQLRADFQQPNYSIKTGHKVAMVTAGQQIVQEYVFECLPSSVSPYHQSH